MPDCSGEPMKNHMPWGPSPALGHYTYWPHAEKWEFSEGMYAILGIPETTPVTTDLVRRHQHPDDAGRTEVAFAMRDLTHPADYSYPHRIVDALGLVHEVVVVGRIVPDGGELGPRIDGFLVDVSEVGAHPAQSAPMVPVEFDASDLVITPCAHCPQWWAEIVPSGGIQVVREWHEPYCPEALRWSVPEPPMLARWVS